MQTAPVVRRAGRLKEIPDGPDASRHDLRILNAIRQIIRAADIDSRKLADEHDITSPQLITLMAVVEKGSITATEISGRIHLSESTLVGVLERLEGKGLIKRERDDHDRRVIWVSPTKEGRELAAKTPFPLQFSLNKALRQLPAQEREQMAGCMERLVELMGAQGIDPAPMLEIVALGKREQHSAPHAGRKRKGKIG